MTTIFMPIAPRGYFVVDISSVGIDEATAEAMINHTIQADRQSQISEVMNNACRTLAYSVVEGNC